MAIKRKTERLQALVDPDTARQFKLIVEQRQVSEAQLIREAIQLVIKGDMKPA